MTIKAAGPALTVGDVYTLLDAMSRAAHIDMRQAGEAKRYDDVERWEAIIQHLLKAKADVDAAAAILLRVGAH